jgi:hypothetical protein
MSWTMARPALLEAMAGIYLPNILASFVMCVGALLCTLKPVSPTSGASRSFAWLRMTNF